MRSLRPRFVVLGVILALAANEWREHRASVEQAEHAFASILEELETNRSAVKKSHDYHLGLLQAIRRATETLTPPDLDTFSRGLVSTAYLHRTAWDSASATGAFEDIGFSTILRLSLVYAQQDRYEVQAQGIAPIIYGELYRGGTQTLLDNHRNLANLIGAFLYRERELLSIYDETFDAVGESLDGENAPTC